MGEERLNSGTSAGRPGVGKACAHLFLSPRNGSIAGLVFEVRNRAVTLGRGQNADISVASATGVSRNHARVSFSRQGEPTVDDLGSKNGTFLNGHGVAHGVLHDGDRLDLGAAVLFDVRLAQAPLRGADRGLQLVHSGAPGNDEETLLAALETRTQRFGSCHPSVAACMDGLGRLAFEAGQHEQAKLHFERSIQVLRASSVAHPGEVAHVHLGLAHCLQSLGEESAAVAAARQADQLLREAGASEIEFALVKEVIHGDATTGVQRLRPVTEDAPLRRRRA